MIDTKSSARVFWSIIATCLLFALPTSAFENDTAKPSDEDSAVSQLITPVNADTFSYMESFPAKSKAAQETLVGHKVGALSTIAPKTKMRFPLVKIILFSASLIIIVLTALFYSKKWRNKDNFIKQTRLSIMDRVVRRACRYIEEHYENVGLDPATTCKELVTGEAFLEALFERELGMKVTEFINQVRVHHVSRLREDDPAIGLEDVAKQTGFADENSLRKMFRAVTGKDVLAK